MIASLASLLVPPEAPGLPDGFEGVRVNLSAGLPQRLELGGEHHAVLVLPTGLARTWLAADPAQEIGSSAAELAPYDPEQPEAALGARPPLLLVVRAGTSVLGSVPVVAGLRRTCRDDGGPAAVELWVGAWRLCAGSARGPGDYGSFLEFGWRRADRPVNVFGSPPTSPFVLKRMPLIERFESELGRRRRAHQLALRRFNLRRTLG